MPNESFPCRESGSGLMMQMLYNMLMSRGVPLALGGVPEAPGFLDGHP